MKPGLATFLAVATAGLTALSVWLGRELQRARATTTVANRIAEQERDARQQLEGQAQYNDRVQRELREKVYDLSAMVAGLRASEATYSSNYAGVMPPAPATTEATATNNESGLFGKGMGEMLTKMMKDPAMRELIRAQQKMVFKPVYEPLMRQWNLSAEEQQKFMNLLLDQQMGTMDRSQMVLGKEKLEGTELAKQTKQAIEQSEQSLKEFLGEERFAQQKEYQKTIGERMHLNQFKTQLAETEMPLRDEQYDAVMALIKDEREKFPPQVGNAGEDSKDINKLFAGDAMQKHLEWQDQLNQRVRERVTQVLTPEQSKAFADFQEQQLSMQKFGIKMAQEMFGGKDGVTEPK